MISRDRLRRRLIQILEFQAENNIETSVILSKIKHEVHILRFVAIDIDFGILNNNGSSTKLGGNIVSGSMVQCPAGYHLDHRKKCRKI